MSYAYRAWVHLPTCYTTPGISSKWLLNNVYVFQ